ncbi:family 16 glycosylhydrolase [Thalassotalea sp. PLHSN55]|uniref:glycoside hydrolase family 16 protein n=1 Tax=Thalassotalea sp. PLHSN55 TaxID=3435888 RepID=UPI003F8595C9
MIKNTIYCLTTSLLLISCTATKPEAQVSIAVDDISKTADYKSDDVYTRFDPSMLPDSQVDSTSFDYSNWQLVWADEFDYANDQLDKKWISQNGPTGHPLVASSRWRENAVVNDGILELQARKESRGGQDWTTGNVWSKRGFGYGYFEARYQYAAATATNNSFWLWPAHGSPKGAQRCEVDINEGHFPNVVNSNVHNWTDKWTTENGYKKHYNNQIAHTFVGQPDHSIKLDKPIKTNKIRLVSKNPKSVHLREFRVFDSSVKTLPSTTESLNSNVKNLAMADNVTITTNGESESSKTNFMRDNNLDTRWVSKKSSKKWLQLEWSSEQEISSVQIMNGLTKKEGINNGWLSDGLANRNLMTDYTLEYHDGKQWVTIKQYNSAEYGNFGEEFHTYGVAWDKDYFRFYFDGELFYTVRNDACFSETAILFSLAILKKNYSGEITDDLDGTAMKIDYVRYYQAKD